MQPMHALNGRADLAGPRIELGDIFLPERREVKLNGEVYLGWVASDGHYPREVLARLGRAYRRYSRVVQPLLDPQIPPCPHTEGPEFDAWQREKDEDTALREKASDEQDLAYQRYLTEAVLTLVPLAPETVVSLVPADKLYDLLTELGYFRPNELAVPTGDEGEKAVEALPLTGASSPDASPDSMESVQTNS